MLHVYIFDTKGCAEGVKVAQELVATRLPDVRVLPVSCPPIREMMIRDGRVPLVPCVVSIDTRTGEWKNVYTNEFLVSHFLEPLRAATKKSTVVIPEEALQRRSMADPHHQKLSVAEIAQRMMDEREKEGLQGNRRRHVQN